MNRWYCVHVNMYSKGNYNTIDYDIILFNIPSVLLNAIPTSN